MLSKVSHCVLLCMLVLIPFSTTTRVLALQKFSNCFQHHVTTAVTGSLRIQVAPVRRRVLDRSNIITMSAAASTAAAAATAAIDDSIPASSSSSPLAAATSSNSGKQQEQEEKRRLVVVLAGPTAVGKSRVAAKLCADLQDNQHHSCGWGGGMIVSADSVQAYRGVEIGANKPTLTERDETPHILLDMVDADDAKYNAAEWTRDALYAIQKLLLIQQNDDNDNNIANDKDEQEALDDTQQQRQRQCTIDTAIQQAKLQKSIPLDKPVVPVVVGGTMMYLTWLVHGRPDALRPSDSAMNKAATEIQKYQSTSDDNNNDNNDGDWEGAVRAVGALGSTFALQIQKLCGHDWYRLRRILEVAYTSMEETNKQQQGGNNNNNNNNNDGKDDIDDDDDDDDTSKVTHKLYSGEREGGLLSSSSSSPSPYDVRCFFLCPNDRMQHSKVIDERCEQMLLRGLISETANLWITGKLPDMACKAIGYRQTLDYLQRPNARNDDKIAFAAYLQDFCTATRRYSKRQMQWFRKDEEFVFVPISLLDTTANDESTAEHNSTTTTAADHASKEIQRMLNLSRPEFDKERLDEAGVSAETRRRNEAQGAKMKVYQHKPQILHEKSKELETILQQADDCTNRVQAKKPRR